MEIPSVVAASLYVTPHAIDLGEREIAGGITLPAGLCEQCRQAFRQHLLRFSRQFDSFDALFACADESKKNGDLTGTG